MVCTQLSVGVTVVEVVSGSVVTLAFALSGEEIKDVPSPIATTLTWYVVEGVKPLIAVCPEVATDEVDKRVAPSLE